MCQFNLVFVKNSKNKEILKNNGYHRFGDNFDDFCPYVKNHCNCNSFVGSMCEYSVSSYHEMLETLNKSELENLNKIKVFMNRPDYNELRKKYIAEKEKLSHVLEKFFESISDYEIEQINLLEKKYKGKVLQKNIEFLYKELDEKTTEIENSAEFKSAEAKLNELTEKNKLMDESTLYYLTKEDEDNDKKLDEIPDDNLIEEDDLFPDSDDFIETIEIPEEESFVIDAVIQKLQNQYENDYSVFLEYKQLFENLLENEEYLLFCCIWDEHRKLSIKKGVNINELTIEDLASLKFNHILKICK